jgi:hypothetical protein
MTVVVRPEKIKDYLLVLKGKGHFFLRKGYTLDDWQQLQAVMENIGNTYFNNKIWSRHNGFGNEYTITVTLKLPNGEIRDILTAWCIRDDAPDIFSFTTAHPV